MANLTQLELTNFFCTAAEFNDMGYQFDRIWRQTLFLFKVKAFKLMYHYATHQTNIVNGTFPPHWHQFGDSLPENHVMNRNTFMMLMANRMLSIEDLQQTGYKQLSIHEVELFSTCEEFLKSTFTLNEFVYAASRVITTM